MTATERRNDMAKDTQTPGGMQECDALFAALHLAETGESVCISNDANTRDAVAIHDFMSDGKIEFVTVDADGKRWIDKPPFEVPAGWRPADDGAGDAPELPVLTKAEAEAKRAEWRQQLEEFLTAEFTLTTAIYEYLGISEKPVGQHAHKVVNSILEELGYRRTRRRINGRKPWGYAKVDVADEEPEAPAVEAEVEVGEPPAVETEARGVDDAAEVGEPEPEVELEPSVAALPLVEMVEAAPFTFIRNAETNAEGQPLPFGKEAGLLAQTERIHGHYARRRPSG